MTDTYYHFLSSLRQGLATSIKTLPGGKRAEVGIRIQPARRKLDSGEWDTDLPPIDRIAQLYGPGDIAVFDERIVVRKEPLPNTGNYEPNYFPAVEFADPDYPWRFSPEPVAARGSSQPAAVVALTPWITLVVLVAEDRGDAVKREFEKLPRGRNQRPAIRVTNQKNLPQLSYAWKWAHVQVTTGTPHLLTEPIIDQGIDNRDELTEVERRAEVVRILAATSEDDLKTLVADGLAALIAEQISAMVAEEIKALHASRPDLVVSRLMCTRRLRPQTLYRAFVVPTYKLGWAAALDTPAANAATVDTGAVELAWDHTSTDPIDLPYFVDWEFRTSERGDFEYLVRLLEARKLSGLGLRDMDCERPGFGLTFERSAPDANGDPVPEEEKHLLELEGALQSLDTEYTRWGKDANGPAVEGQPAPEVPEPAGTQVQLADELLNQANLHPRVRYDNDPGVDPAVIERLSFSVLDDGKTVRFSWRTPGDTTGTLEYWIEGGPMLDVVSPASGDSHAVTAVLVPEQPYRFQLRIQRSGVETTTAAGEITVLLPAVVPPIYGRWHAARHAVEADAARNAWVDVLNLDPRHRASAGFGSEMVRKQQDGLMASAWDQIGTIEAANDILRRAQLGREGSIFLHNRLGDLGLEDFLRLTCPVQKRVVRDTQGGDRKTVAAELAAETSVPAAALSPALRRISRPRGPLRRRQKTRRVDMLRRLFTGKNAEGEDDALSPAGPHPTPDGTLGACEVTTRMYQQALFDTWTKADDSDSAPGGGVVTLPGGGDTAPGVGAFVTPVGGGIVPEAPPILPVTPDLIPVPDEAKRFCEDVIDSTRVRQEMNAGVDGIENDETVDAVADALDGFLQPGVAVEPEPDKDVAYVQGLRDDIQMAIDPRVTIVNRTKRRLNLRDGDLAARFDKNAPGDPLDPIMAYPEFPQPMYEPLRDLSQSNILPGIETVPQNTVSLLETNGRFVESYMVGLNHEFAGELLWRRYPTDQRGSYFRQFWNVEGYVPDPLEVDSDGSLKPETIEKLKDIAEIHEWGPSELGDNDSREVEGAGDSDGEDKEALVLIVRGDLFKRYPNALVYAVDARREGDEFRPKLPEWAEDPTGGGGSVAKPEFPIFSGSLGSDLVFFGFSFSEEEARSSDANPGKYFILEERVSEARFGLDSPPPLDEPITVEGWDDQTWGDFQTAEVNDPITIGKWGDLHWGEFQMAMPAETGGYLDASLISIDVGGETWNHHSDAALRARITFQKPARISVHADQMMPDEDGPQ